MNSRSSERVNGFFKILQGYLVMLGGLAGDQWNEGDVSCSVVRRIALPGSFYCIDGMLETFLTILNQMQTFPAVIAAENEKYFPYLSTTTILMEAVKAGAGREEAHEAIKEHAVATVLDMRNGAIEKNNLLERLSKDTRLRLSLEALKNIIAHAQELTGAAGAQVDAFARKTDSIAGSVDGAKEYAPGSIL